MVEVVFNLPHETRIFALQCAVEFVNGDARKSSAWKAPEVVDIARVFEEYLTAAPVAGFENKPDEGELVGDEDAGS